MNGNYGPCNHSVTHDSNMKIVSRATGLKLKAHSPVQAQMVSEASKAPSYPLTW